MLYALILSMHGPFITDSSSLATLSGFTSYRLCAAAGQIFKRQHPGARWSCVRVK